jgi:hypothetical protein
MLKKISKNISQPLQSWDSFSIFFNSRKFKSIKVEDKIEITQEEPVNQIAVQPETEITDLQKVKTYKVQDVYSIQSKKMGHPDPQKHFDFTRVKNGHFYATTFSKAKFNKRMITKETAIPISAKLGPFEIVSPIMDHKTYHWCSCGMSKNQVFLKIK